MKFVLCIKQADRKCGEKTWFDVAKVEFASRHSGYMLHILPDASTFLPFKKMSTIEWIDCNSNE